VPLDMIEVVERIACVEADIENLKEWQSKQNGTLQRLDAKVENLYRIAIGTLVTVLGTLLAAIGNMVM